jgi:hypothetical protein
MNDHERSRTIMNSEFSGTTFSFGERSENLAMKDRNCIFTMTLQNCYLKRRNLH